MTLLPSFEGRRLHRVSDTRLLRRLPWRRDKRDAILEALGAPARPPAVDIRKLREREGLSRPDFAAIYGIGEQSLKRWEAGATPPAAARALLAVIEAHPHLVRRALGLRW